MIAEPARSATGPTVDVARGPPHSGVERGAIAVITDHHGRLLLHLRDDIPGIV